ncbi:MAG: FAD-dependent oxidoreductase [bacterium]|nr:FAD-dependent oxidoreductase [bacterium]MCY3579093.1 FAD-dependent oxidoreductase [bacterium]MCY3653207.1 FAD-dependent oxidoreductase [bacterium]MYF26373.1 FAD-binding oxidoreductase [Acidimicrobiia bacterium]
MTRRREGPIPRGSDLVIIGAGIVGASTAFWAARSGLSPVILEARPLPASLTTPASTGAFRLQFDNREETELVRESVDLILNFSEITGLGDRPLAISQPGYLWATTSEEKAENQRRLVERQHSWGQTDIELLSGDEARRRFPYLSRKVVGARYRQDDGFLEPGAFTLGLIKASNAALYTSCRVEAIEERPSGGFDLLTSRGAIQADSVVIAAGPFTAQLADWAGIDLPLEIKPRHKVVIPELKRVPSDAPMTIDDDTGVHWRPFLSGAALLDAAPRGPGREPMEDVPPDSEMAFRVLDPAGPEAAARICPFWEEAWNNGELSWMVHSGQYVMSPDHRPLIGPTPVKGLWVNTGYSGHGIMCGPAGGRILADLITSKLDRSPFALDRTFVKRTFDQI